MVGGENGKRAAVILAGGDGSRLRALVRNMTGQNVPKQFCSLLGESTLIERTRRRAEIAVAPGNILYVVNQSHEQYYGPLLRDVPAANIVVQPEDKGTAPAVLLALLRMAATAPEVSVAIFPSDHFLSNDSDFMRHVEVAFDAVEQRPEFTVVLAMQPSHPEADYGWIEPAEKVAFGAYDLYRVRALWDHPDRDQAQQLLRRGGLWNSAVTVGRLSTILGMIMVTARKLYAAFAPLRAKFPQSPSPRNIALVYKDLAPMGFSEQVLGGAAVNLAALPVARVRWANLGEPGRLQQTWNQLGLKPLWSIGS
jgi:mannose-1-phosphate guanylyltransferase